MSSRHRKFRALPETVRDWRKIIATVGNDRRGLSRGPRLADYSERMAEFRDWVLTEVNAQANYTDRYAFPALEPYDRDGEVVNRVVTNRWYEEQHQELYRRGIVGLP